MLIEPFAAYGFNKAHAASYGRVAYQTAYMKANFPAIYMSAVLTADSGDVEKIGEIVNECKRMGIPVLPPSVNESSTGFTVVKDDGPDKIRFGLTTIKNFGEAVARSIIEARERGGKFKSLSDFLRRIKDRNLNKKSLESLAKSGALDELGERGAMLGNLEYLLEYHKETAKEIANQDSLFGLTAAEDAPLRLSQVPPATTTDKLSWEKELLGLYLSGHPLDKYREVLAKRELNIKRAKEELKEGMITVLTGMVEETKTIFTKKNESMCFLRMADFNDSIETVIFPKVYEEFKKMLVPEKCLAIRGRISHRNGAVSIIADRIKALT
ncbi:MAG: hypothetical protein HYT43_00655 [Candidatus Taylorbacteria bacterium]|nr:hypothetical protein [Candidatus Taylorbacteria bacterium]